MDLLRIHQSKYRKRGSEPIPEAWFFDSEQPNPREPKNCSGSKVRFLENSVFRVSVLSVKKVRVRDSVVGYTLMWVLFNIPFNQCYMIEGKAIRLRTLYEFKKFFEKCN